LPVEIVALDPGTTTGLATKTGDDYKSFHIRPDMFAHPHEALYDLLCNLQPKIVIYEPFHFRSNMDGAVFTGIEYIGVIELYCQLKYVEVITITPAYGQAFWDDRKLKAIGRHNKNHVHGNDAMRLLLSYLMKNDNDFRNKILQILKENL
jgi:hypothetical protein